MNKTEQIRAALEGARQLIGREVKRNVVPPEQQALYEALALLDTHVVVPREPDVGMTSAVPTVGEVSGRNILISYDIKKLIYKAMITASEEQE